MKSFSTVFLIFFYLTISFAQNNSPKDKAAVFLGGIERYDNMVASNPGYVLFLETRVTSGYTIVDFNSDRMIGYVLLNELTQKSLDGNISISIADFLAMNDNGTLNILLFSFPSDNNGNLIFKLGNTNKALIVYSTSHINSLIQN